MIKTLSCLILFFSFTAHAKLAALSHSKIAFYIPHVVDPKYVGLEFGFITQKKLKRYPYNAFVKAILIEESPTEDDLRAAALGAKAGLIFPTQPWLPIYVELAFGYAKAIKHASPWLGKRDETVSSNRLALIEAGLLIVLKKKFILKINHQINNVDYFKQAAYFSIGVNF